MDHRQKAVKAFCEECVWARAMRTHFSQLFESGEQLGRLLSEVANTFFHDLNIVLLEYVILQQCKLTDPASSGKDKDNLTSNYIVGLDWSDETRLALTTANAELMVFRPKIDDARRKLIVHSDLRARLELLSLGSFTEMQEQAFWAALQEFINIAHGEAFGGPFPLDASMPDGDALSLVHSLREAVDYDDLVKSEDGFLTRRIDKMRYRS